MALASSIRVDKDAIRNFQQPAQRNRRTAELYRRLLAVNELATQMAAASEPEELKRCLQRSHPRWMPGASASIRLTFGGTFDSKRVSSGNGTPDDAALTLSDSFVNRCLSHRSPLLISDTLKSPDAASLFDGDRSTGHARSIMVFPLLASGSCLGCLIITSLHPEQFGALDYHLGLLVATHLSSALANTLALQRLVATNARLREEDKKLTELNHRLRDLATTDDLTGLSNRRQINRQLDAELARILRYGGELSCLMIDVDGFKQINDSCGHRAGDRVLCQLSALLRQSCRATDLVARYGGDEFTVLLPQTGLGGALCAAEKLRSRVAAKRFVPAGDQPVALTISVGAACWLPSLQGLSCDLLARADRALYIAKRSGGNRVAVVDSPSETGSRNCQTVELQLTQPSSGS